MGLCNVVVMVDGCGESKPLSSKLQSHIIWLPEKSSPGTWSANKREDSFLFLITSKTAKSNNSNNHNIRAGLIILHMLDKHATTELHPWSSCVVYACVHVCRDALIMCMHMVRG